RSCGPTFQGVAHGRDEPCSACRRPPSNSQVPIHFRLCVPFPIWRGAAQAVADGLLACPAREGEVGNDGRRGRVAFPGGVPDLRPGGGRKRAGCGGGADAPWLPGWPRALVGPSRRDRACWRSTWTGLRWRSASSSQELHAAAARLCADAFAADPELADDLPDRSGRHRVPMQTTHTSTPRTSIHSAIAAAIRTVHPLVFRLGRPHNDQTDALPIPYFRRQPVGPPIAAVDSGDVTFDQ